jgi:hypothetical protein
MATDWIMKIQNYSDHQTNRAIISDFFAIINGFKGCDEIYVCFFIAGL